MSQYTWHPCDSPVISAHTIYAYIHESYVTANNPWNNNVVFFFCFRFEDSLPYQLLILDHNALDKRQKFFGVTSYWGRKSLKTVQEKFCRKFNFNNHPQKSQIYRWVFKFQATGSVNNLNKRAENPVLAGSWLQDVLTIWIRWEILS